MLIYLYICMYMFVFMYVCWQCCSKPFAYGVVREHLRGRLKVNGWETLIQTI